MWWDWSKAGKFDKNGKEITQKDASGTPLYVTKKGVFRWAKNIAPEYRWFNGEMNYITFLTKIDDKGVVAINHPDGHSGDTLSRIWPFKVHRGLQPYDPVLKHSKISVASTFQAGIQTRSLKSPAFWSYWVRFSEFRPMRS